MNYEDGKCGSDTLFTFKDLELSTLLSKTNFGFKMNQDFVDSMILKEKEMEDFLINYYDYSIIPLYSNLDKICTLREVREVLKDESAFFF